MSFEVQESLSAIADRSRQAALAYSDAQGLANVYLGGALFAGLGSPKSDTDLFVVVDDDSRLETEQVYRSGLRIDVEYISWGRLERLVGLVERYDIRADDMTQLTEASRSAMDFLTRFKLSEIVSDQGGRLGALRGRLSSATTRYVDVVMARHAMDVSNFAEDVQGALLQNDLQCADYQARESLYVSAEALLASLGDCYVNTKWLWSKWKRTVGDVLGESTTRIVSDPHDENVAVAISRSRWLSQDLLVMALGQVIYEPQLHAPCPGDAVRDPHVSLIRTVGGFLVLRDVEEGVELSLQGALLWGVSHGKPRDVGINETWTLLKEETPDLNEGAVADYFDHLVAIGLLKVSS
jgi:hypothetical protein